MTSADDNTQFIETARSHGMLSQERAHEVLQNASATDIAATVVLQRGLMDAHQVDIVQTLVAGAHSIPGYTLLDVIGYGGMGVVFRARQKALDREVALKTILVGGRVNEAIQRFRKEATSIARLNHPNIVTAFDSGQQDGRIYLSMEFVKGQNLSEYVQEHGTLSEAEALSFTRQAAVGLAHAWEHGIVHRDIKPDNLLITHPSDFDQARTVKITDLGLAHLNTDADAARITQTGAAVGSPLYMAPEQLSGETVDCRSDIYSLGSTLYFMLSNRAPFDGHSIASVLYNKAAGKSIPLTNVANVHDATRQLVELMMQTAPEQRPQDYRSVVREIDRVLQTADASTATSAVSTDPMIRQQDPSPTDPSMQDTTVLETTPAPASLQSQPQAGMPIWIPVTGVLTIIAATFLAWPTPRVPDVPPSTLKMQSTWEEPLFSGSSLDGWRPSLGTELSIETDPVEQATALSLNSTKAPSGSVTRRIPVPANSEPWFELESQMLLGTSTAGGLLFGLTETGPGFRLRITNDAAVLLDETTGRTLASETALPPTNENPVSVTLRLQPNEWLLRVNGSVLGAAPIGAAIQPKIQFFTEGGQTFFTDINATGLHPVKEVD